MAWGIVCNCEAYLKEEGTLNKRWKVLLTNRNEMSYLEREFDKVKLEKELNEFLHTKQGKEWLETERCSKDEKQMIRAVRGEDTFKPLMRK
ncbi:MAG: hypothetical protein NTY73_02645 [Candidatus Micrarchaeota archaeon]|nr:hypothetical protein [Candidatus Micrarchaeota archaeon]